jgi:hypothetical protein
MAKKKSVSGRQSAAKPAATKKKTAKKKAAEKPAANVPETESREPAHQPRDFAPDGRKLRIPVTKFCKPGYEISEEGAESVQIKIKVPDGGSGGAGCSGDSALEFFGRKRLRIRFSRRGVGEWGQGQIVEDGPGQIFDCETEVTSFGWTNGDFHFSFWTDQISFESAKSMYRKAGSLEVEVLGEPVSGDETEDHSASNGAPKRCRPKKAAVASKGPTLPGMTPDELSESHSVALTDKFRVDVKIIGLPEGKFSCQWTGDGPAGECGEAEPSVRSSSVQAVISSIGRAVDHWLTYPGAEERKIVEQLRHWLHELEAGKTPNVIESELADEEPDDDDEFDDDEFDGDESDDDGDE